ncbi:uncharacterized protein H6S33_002423 [Morchella sextelata]|uniref:uncharacterized protein n=1 Tax=Morchella sextelata TaxID=1174677 RepID=UPI001D052AC8|nr:uncharacterized protein H6S33_002423 [Morchella sextelata]KAH0607389.1 hypothetical protein H6S33_002423 [Morchella sextelata]
MVHLSTSALPYVWALVDLPLPREKAEEKTKPRSANLEENNAMGWGGPIRDRERSRLNTRFDPGISEICHSAMAIHVSNSIEASTWGKLIPTLACPAGELSSVVAGARVVWFTLNNHCTQSERRVNEVMLIEATRVSECAKLSKLGVREVRRYTGQFE